MFIRDPRIVEPARGGGSPRRLDYLLDVAEAEHFDAALNIGQRWIDFERRLERGKRFGVAFDREERLALADKGRHVRGRCRQGGIESGRGTVVIAATQRHVEVLRFRNVQQVIEAARAAASAGRLDDARVAYEHALATSPDSAFLHREIGIVDRRQGNVDAALGHFARAIELDPGDTVSLIETGDLLARRQDLVGAEAAYRKAAALEPSAELTAKLAATAEGAREARLPAEFKAIGKLAQVTRGDLAALIAVRLEPILASVPERQVVITDTRGHWAATYITQVARAGVVEAFENHTFQPAARPA